MKGLTLAWLAGALLGLNAMAPADELQALKRLSLEELADLEVSILGHRPERYMDAGAAIFVLTAEDIRRSGYTSLAQLMRLVPGMAVARIASDEWAISARGFNSRFANKLLVMIDGRSVYNSLFSGVYWENLAPPLADIERIEVIRGPGASTWGANAVNGVINIITRHAQDTQGGLLQGWSGDRQQGGLWRQGLRLGESGHLRLWARHQREAPQAPLAPEQAVDSLERSHLGFRGDWVLPGDDELMVEGEWFETDGDDPWMDGGSLMASWRRLENDGAVDQAQIYYSRFEMDTGADPRRLTEHEEALDLELRRHFQPLGRHDLVVGLGWRWQRSRIRPAPLITARQPNRVLQRYSAFFQDEIRLVPERLFLTLGTKLEHNDFSGFELQPTVRARWHPAPDQVVWAAVSRAVRTPSRSEHDLRAEVQGLPPSPETLGLPVDLRTTGSRNMVPEVLVAWESGYRWHPNPNLGLDLALFYNDYERLRTMESGRPGLALDPYARWVVPVDARNRMAGHTWGLELVSDWRPRDGLRLQAWYALLRMNLTAEPGSRGLEGTAAEGQSPRHQAGLRLSLDLRHDLEADLFLRHVSALPEFDVDAYAELDLRLGWRPNERLSVALAGHNLLHDRHQEFGEETVLHGPPTGIRRQWLLELAWRY